MISICFQVCGYVDDIQCDIEPYTDCKLKWTNVEYNTTEEFVQKWPAYTCEMGTANRPHIKQRPVCTNDTMPQCVSEWRFKPDGTKVCKPILNTEKGYICNIMLQINETQLNM